MTKSVALGADASRLSPSALVEPQPCRGTGRGWSDACSRRVAPAPKRESPELATVAVRAGGRRHTRHQHDGRSFSWLRGASLLGLVVTLGAGACGSEDGSKKAPSDRPEGGATSGGGASGDDEDNRGGGGGGEPSDGGSEVGGSSGSGEGGATAGDAGSGGSSMLGGAAGSETSGGAAGAAGAPAGIECALGTADCDDDPSDCETNIATDATHCGRCERACGATAACTNGLCDATVLLDPTDNSNFCSGVFTATTAYMLTCWGNNDLTELRSTPLEPGASILGTEIKRYSPETNNAVSLVALRGLLIDGDQVLYGLQENPGHIYKFPLDADGPEDVSIAYTFENGMRFDYLSLVGDTFYWHHNTYTAGGQVAPSTIKKRKKSEVASTTLVTGLGTASQLQVFPSQMVWVEQRTAGNYAVYRAATGGADIADVELVAVATAGTYLQRRGDYAYWTHKAAAPNGKLRRLKADDPAATAEDVLTGLNLPEGLALDDDYAYFKQADALYRVALSGGTAEQLSTVVAAHDAQATAIFHVDDQYVYFAAGPGFGFSTLVRVAK